MDIKIGEQTINGDCATHGQVFAYSVQFGDEDTFFVCAKNALARLLTTPVYE